MDTTRKFRLEKFFSEIASKDVGLHKYLYFFGIRPSTVTIVNKSTSGSGWTAVTTGLTGVLAWKLNEKNRNTFRYAYESSPSTFMTAFGSIQRDTDISAVYVKRIGGTNIDMELEIWSE